MCITHTNIHACGHSSYVDTDICQSHYKAVEIVTYMACSDAEKEANPREVDRNVLLTLLAEWRSRCAHESEEWGRRRNYKCEGCLEEMLKRTGLVLVGGEAEEGNRVNWL